MTIRRVASNLLARAEHAATRRLDQHPTTRGFLALAQDGARFAAAGRPVVPSFLGRSAALAIAGPRISRLELATGKYLSYSIFVGDPIDIVSGQATDYSRVFNDLNLSQKARVGIVHVDVVDDIFAPAKPEGVVRPGLTNGVSGGKNNFGPFFTKTQKELPGELEKFLIQLRAATTLPIEVHLMVEHPETYVAAMARSRVDIVTITGEHDNISNDVDPSRIYLLRELNRMGIHAGLAINPNTPLHKVFELLGDISVLTVMGVTPGKSGQKLQLNVAAKLRDARHLIDRRHVVALQIDGGVSTKTISDLTAANLRVSASVVGRESDLTARSKVVDQLLI